MTVAPNLFEPLPEDAVRLEVLRQFGSSTLILFWQPCAHVPSNTSTGWKQVRFRNNMDLSVCWWWRGNGGGPLFRKEQTSPQLIADPGELAWTVLTRALPPNPPGQIIRYCESPGCINPKHR